MFLRWTNWTFRSLRWRANGRTFGEYFPYYIPPDYNLWIKLSWLDICEVQHKNGESRLHLCSCCFEIYKRFSQLAHTQERRNQIAPHLRKVLAVGRFDHQIVMFSHLDLIWHFSLCYSSQYWSLVSRLDLQINRFRDCNTLSCSFFVYPFNF